MENPDSSKIVQGLVAEGGRWVEVNDMPFWQVFQTPPGGSRREIMNTPSWTWKDIAHSLSKVEIKLPNIGESNAFDWGYLGVGNEKVLSKPYGSVILRRTGDDLDILIEFLIPQDEYQQYLDKIVGSYFRITGFADKKETLPKETFEFHSSNFRPSGTANSDFYDEETSSWRGKIIIGRLISGK